MSLPSQLADPSMERNLKPRSAGITMVIDKGIGLNEYMDLLQLSSSYIDYIKLGFGTCMLYPKPLLQKKIELAGKYQVKIFPGGTMSEIAIIQNSIEPYLNYIKEIGFSSVEISEGSIDLDPTVRSNFIEKALQLGLEVITELGKKESGFSLDPYNIIQQLQQDLSLGVSYVIVEGRESGVNVGIYDANGDLNEGILRTLSNRESYMDRLIWEAPLKKQQAHLITMFGPNVNLGNIPTGETIALEALRRGLRSDTLIRYS